MEATLSKRVARNFIVIEMEIIDCQVLNEDLYSAEFAFGNVLHRSKGTRGVYILLSAASWGLLLGMVQASECQPPECFEGPIPKGFGPV